ncbi:MAG: sensor histidine kinase [Actinomycetota bacterium]
MGEAFQLAQKHDAAGRTASDLARFVMSLHELVLAEDRDEAIRSAVRLCGIQFEAPAAAWHHLPDQEASLLHASYGFDTDSKPALEAELGLVASSDESHMDDLRQRFAAVTGRVDALVLRAEPVIILVASSERDPSPPFGFEPLIAQMFALVDEASRSRKRGENLDMSLALTAHELRSPLLSVKAAIETSLLAKDESLPDPVIDRSKNLTGQLLTRAHDELGHLAETCETLLYWAVDDDALEFDPVDLSQNVIAAIRACSHERNFEAVSFEPPSEHVKVPGSPKHLRVALSNLIRNALYYSPPGEPVVVAIEQLTRSIRITVTDKGPGVPKGQHRSIFDPFVRGLGNTSPRSGRGLGLFIAKRVVEGHRGRIWTDTRERGAKFVIELPRAKESE